MPHISLREITSATVGKVCRLAVLPEQEKFVASNAYSLAEALFAEQAWYRGVYADDVLVGFVMLWDDTLGSTPAPRPEVCLWRLMIDARHQGRGYGAATIALVVQHVRSRPGICRFYSSFVPAEREPEKFYLSLGFEPTGDLDEDGEVIIEYPLRPPPR
jgi:diamine N-acetyltransferase